MNAPAWLAAGALLLCGCTCQDRDPPMKPSTPSASASAELPPGTRVRFTAGDRIGETGTLRGRTPNVPHELYDIALDSDGTIVSSAPDRFERAP